MLFSRMNSLLVIIPSGGLLMEHKYTQSKWIAGSKTETWLVVTYSTRPAFSCMYTRRNKNDTQLLFWNTVNSICSSTSASLHKAPPTCCLPWPWWAMPRMGWASSWSCLHWRAPNRPSSSNIWPGSSAAWESSYWTSLYPSAMDLFWILPNILNFYFNPYPGSQQMLIIKTLHLQFIKSFSVFSVC